MTERPATPHYVSLLTDPDQIVALAARNGGGDLADENRYILYEVYADEEAFKEHLATSHAQAAMARSQDWADKGFKVTRPTSVYPTEQRYFATPNSEE